MNAPYKYELGGTVTISGHPLTVTDMRRLHAECVKLPDDFDYPLLKAACRKFTDEEIQTAIDDGNRRAR